MKNEQRTKYSSHYYHLERDRRKSKTFKLSTCLFSSTRPHDIPYHYPLTNFQFPIFSISAIFSFIFLQFKLCTSRWSLPIAWYTLNEHTHIHIFRQSPAQARAWTKCGYSVKNIVFSFTQLGSCLLPLFRRTDRSPR